MNINRWRKKNEKNENVVENNMQTFHKNREKVFHFYEYCVLLTTKQQSTLFDKNHNASVFMYLVDCSETLNLGHSTLSNRYRQYYTPF